MVLKILSYIIIYKMNRLFLTGFPESALCVVTGVDSSTAGWFEAEPCEAKCSNV